jgi:OOP family OmpA-OmpF porin
MRVTRLLAVVFLGSSGLITASQTSAQAPESAAGLYVGGSVGQSSFDKDIVHGRIDQGTVDTSHTGFKVFGGYQFNKNVGLEVTYLDLGKASYDGAWGPDPVTGGKVEVTGVNLSAIGSWPVVPNLDVFGKIGLLSWEGTVSDVYLGLPSSGRNEGTDVSFGLGASWHITKNVSARLEWERFRVDDTDADLFSVGAVYKF